MTSILEQLGWESPHKKRKSSKLKVELVYRQPSNRRSKNQDPMAFQVSCDKTGIYKYSFFPDIIRDWNALPLHF